MRKTRKKIITRPMPPARADGKPQYYDVAEGVTSPCIYCEREGNHTQYGHQKVFMNDPANWPEGFTMHGVYTMCEKHLPDDAMIFNPMDKHTRSKDGKLRWIEKPGDTTETTQKNENMQ